MDCMHAGTVWHMCQHACEFPCRCARPGLSACVPDNQPARTPSPLQPFSPLHTSLLLPLPFQCGLGATPARLLPAPCAAADGGRLAGRGQLGRVRRRRGAAPLRHQRRRRNARAVGHSSRGGSRAADCGAAVGTGAADACGAWYVF
eukprot:230955-Chlamydomonas_euryale.AAC.2